LHVTATQHILDVRASDPPLSGGPEKEEAMTSKPATALALAAAALAVLAVTVPVAAAPVTLHGTATGALRWKFTNPDVGRKAALGALGTVTPLRPGASFTGSEHFPGFVASGYVQGRGKLSSTQGTITLSFRFGPYKGFTTTITTRGTYHIVSGTGQFAGATGNGVVGEKIGGPIGTGPNPRPQHVTISFNPPPILTPILH
jgi:hypothetical protein